MNQHTANSPGWLAYPLMNALERIDQLERRLEATETVARAALDSVNKHLEE